MNVKLITINSLEAVYFNSFIYQYICRIIATPGRLLHVAVEMNLKLKSVEYLVFDEADRLTKFYLGFLIVCISSIDNISRLFEMGFEEQLKDVIKRLPDDRQTLLFSATLPKNLVDFAKFGLNEPVLVRLDVENKISDKLNVNLVFFKIFANSLENFFSEFIFCLSFWR